MRPMCLCANEENATKCFKSVNMKLEGVVSRHSVKLGNYKMPFYLRET